MGLLFGGVLEPSNIHTACQQNGTMRVGILISPHYQISTRNTVSIQLLSSGQLIPTSGCSFYDATAQVETILSKNRPSNTILAKSNFTIYATGNLKLNLNLGAGLNTYSYGYINEEVHKVRQNCFVWSPGMQLRLQRYFIEVVSVLAGKTPSFHNSSQNVVLQGTRSDQLYLTIGYSLF